MESFEQILGRNLRIIRKQKGFRSQEALAEALGIERTTVARWETGVSRPSPESMMAIQKVLGCSYAELIGESEPTPQTPVEEKLAALTRQIESLRSQIETMQPKPSDGKGRESTGVYQYTKDTIVSKSQPRKSQESQPQLTERDRALLEAWQSASEGRRRAAEAALGLLEYEPPKNPPAPAKHKSKA